MGWGWSRKGGYDSLTNYEKYLKEIKSGLFKQGSKFTIWQSILKTNKKQDLPLISTFIYTMIQINLDFANTIWKHMIIKNLDYLFQNVFTEIKASQKHSFKQSFN